MHPLVAQLFIYPVKGCQSVAVQQLSLHNSHVEQDRIFAFVNEKEGNYLSQTNTPLLAAIKVFVDGNYLHLQSEKSGAISILAKSDGTRLVPLKSPEGTVFLEDLGEQAAQWISEHLQQNFIRLTRRPSSAPKIAPHSSTIKWNLHFAYRSPLHIISLSSLADLNAKTQQHIPADRFRPNIILANSPTYAEDLYQYLRIGSVNLLRTESCYRCVYTTTDQKSGQRMGKEPLYTLNKYRKSDQGVSFGAYFLPLNEGEIVEGTTLELISESEAVSI